VTVAVIAAPAPPTLVYNPLPVALGHYEKALADTLAAAGVSGLARSATSIETGGGGMATRLRLGARAARAQRRLAQDGYAVIACWPSFGLVDPLVWRRLGRQAQVTVVVHDPEPLDRQFGVGRVWARLGALGLRPGRVGVVVHSTPARDALLVTGWPDPVLLPHPIVAAASPTGVRVAGGTVRVVGRWKPARDLDLMGALGAELAGRGLSPSIAGRGWPPVPGWHLRDAFFGEEELDDAIDTSACVLVPYTRFFQSGIAVRALERGTPVVGPRHPFLEDLLGVSWPGLVASDDPRLWCEAVDAVMAMAPEALAEVRASYTTRCVAAWRRFTDGSRSVR
jgi:hypothetical protein